MRALIAALLIIAATPVEAKRITDISPGAIPELTEQDLTQDRGWIGLNLKSLKFSVAKAAGLKKSGGAVLLGFAKNSPAIGSKLKRNDIILSVNNKTVFTASSVPRLVKAIPIGNSAQLVVWRNGRPLVVPVTVVSFLKSNHALAKAGDITSLKRLGQHFKKSRGPNNMQKALPWFRAAAAAGDSPAMYSIAKMYQYGKGGIEKDLSEAFRWNKMAADNGYQLGLFNVALAYRRGQGIGKDKAKAMEYYRHAAAAGSTYSLFSLGEMYENGEGAPVNFDKAIHYYRKAADKKIWQASLRLGNMFNDGIEIPRNLRAAENYYKKASKFSGEAMHKLAVIYDKGEATPKKPRAAARLIYKAMKRKYRPSARSLAQNPQDWSRAFHEELQITLRRNGHYKGPIDGEYNDGTRAAVAKLYKKDALTKAYKEFFNLFQSRK